MWKAEIVPTDPIGFFPEDDWRSKGIKFEAETSRGAKRKASRWAGPWRCAGKWADQPTPEYQEYSRYVKGQGYLILQATE